MNRTYGEVKVRKNFFPNDARELGKKGNVSFLLTQCRLSKKTKKILNENNIIAYEGITLEEVDSIIEGLQ